MERPPRGPRLLEFLGIAGAHGSVKHPEFRNLWRLGRSQVGWSATEQVSHGLEALGHLSRFAIDDLTADEEDEFFKILEDA